MEFDEYIKMINGRFSIFIFGSILLALFWPRPASAKLILDPPGTITPFVTEVSPTPTITHMPDDDAEGRMRERLQDAVGRLQSVASRLRGVIHETRSYAQAMARERGIDVGAVDRALTRVEDQLSRTDAQVVALSQLMLELDAGTSGGGVLSHARTQLRLIKTSLLSGRDLLRDALGDLRILDQQQMAPTSVPPNITVTPSP